MLKEHGIRKAAVFGAFARGDFDEKSDIDFLIEPPDDEFSLLDLARLKVALEERLERKVDLVTYDSIYEPDKKLELSFWEKIRPVDFAYLRFTHQRYPATKHGDQTPLKYNSNAFHMFFACFLMIFRSSFLPL